MLEAVNTQQHEPQLADATGSAETATPTQPAAQSQVSSGLLCICNRHVSIFE